MPGRRAGPVVPSLWLRRRTARHRDPGAGPPAAGGTAEPNVLRITIVRSNRMALELNLNSSGRLGRSRTGRVHCGVRPGGCCRTPRCWSRRLPATRRCPSAPMSPRSAGASSIRSWLPGEPARYRSTNIRPALPARSTGASSAHLARKPRVAPQPAFASRTSLTDLQEILALSPSARTARSPVW